MVTPGIAVALGVGCAVTQREKGVTAMGRPWKAAGFDPKAWRPPAPRAAEAASEAAPYDRERHLTIIVIGYLASVLTSFVLTMVLLALR
jgi:hypothetical protein